MRILELFSGAGSVGKACAERGWDVVSLDKDQKTDATIKDSRDNRLLQTAGLVDREPSDGAFKRPRIYIQFSLLRRGLLLLLRLGL